MSTADISRYAALVFVLSVATVLFLGDAALSHVQVRPPSAPASSEAVLTLEVVNEQSTSATNRIDIQLPPGVTSVAGRDVNGWRLRLRPAEGVPRRMILTAPEDKELTGEERGRFRFKVGLPPGAGQTLSFKVLQTYDTGEVVRWIGPADSTEPAPTLRLTEAREAGGANPAGGAGEQRDSGPAISEETPGDGDGDSNVVPIVLGVGAGILVAGAIVLLRRRGSRPD